MRMTDGPWILNREYYTSRFSVHVRSITPFILLIFVNVTAFQFVVLVFVVLGTCKSFLFQITQTHYCAGHALYYTLPPCLISLLSRLPPCTS